MSKSALRQSVLSRLRELDQSVISSRSSLVHDALLGHSQYQQAHTVALFAAMEHELSLNETLAHALQQGKKCYLPRIVFAQDEQKQHSGKKPSKLKFLRVFSCEDFLSFEIHKWGIRQPPDEPERELKEDDSLDLMIMPGVAFDKKNNRLGYGMGYYDKFIAEYKDSVNRGLRCKIPYLLAVGLAEQLVDEIPVDEYDQALDEVLIV